MPHIRTILLMVDIVHSMPSNVMDVVSLNPAPVTVRGKPPIIEKNIDGL